jgi:hypothetical protein
MTLSEEKALLSRFGKAAGAGEMFNILDLKAAYEQAMGHAASNSTVYNLLTRHGWRRRDLAAQMILREKSRFPRAVRRARRAAARRGRRLRIMFADEAFRPATVVLGTPPGQARGRLVTHSRIYPSLRRTARSARKTEHASI